MKPSGFAHCLLAAGAILAGGPSFASALARLETPYQAGFRAELLRDETRPYGAPADSVSDEPAQARPIRLYIWYPATNALDQGMPFRRYLHFDHLDESVTAADKRTAETRFREDAATRGLTASEIEMLLSSGTRAIEHAEAATGRFPLVVFGNGLTARGFTYTSLCEYLAGHGYVVVSMPSIGPRAGEDAPFDLTGIELQLGDLVYAIRAMRGAATVDPERIGLVAWSVGGVATALLQMKDASIDAVVSLDSGSAYAYGNEMIRGSAYFDPARLDRPFLQLLALQPSAFAVPKDNSFYAELQSGPKYQLGFPALQHADFTSILGDLRFAATDADKLESFRWLARYTEQFLDAFLGENREARAFLENEPVTNGAPPALVVETDGEYSGAD